MSDVNNEHFSFESMTAELESERRTEHLLRRGSMPIGVHYPRPDLVRHEMEVRRSTGYHDSPKHFSFYKSVAALMAYNDESLPYMPIQEK